MISLVRQSSEPEVVQYWLKREYENRAWVKKLLGLRFNDETVLIGQRNFENAGANASRARMLTAVRPFIPHFQRGGLSEVLRWDLVRMDKPDLESLVLINASDRREMTVGTLRPMDAAIMIEKGTVFSRIDVQQDAEYIKDNAETLIADGSRIIVVGPEKGKLTVVDGVHRITATFLVYFVRRKGDFTALEAYHGVTAQEYNYTFS